MDYSFFKWPARDSFRELRAAGLERAEIDESYRGKYIPPESVDRNIWLSLYWMITVFAQDSPQAAFTQLGLLLLIFAVEIYRYFK